MTLQNPSEAKLAWMIWQALEKLNSLLWEHYEKDFLSFAMEDEDPNGQSTTAHVGPPDAAPADDSTLSQT